MTAAEWANVAVAGGTALLALATGWLAWKTSEMAGATMRVAQETKRLADVTADMARATEGMLEIERDRRQGELVANVVPMRWDGLKGLVVRNTGGANSILHEAWVTDPIRFKQLTRPISAGETVELGVDQWFPVSMAVDKPDDGTAGEGQIWARIKFDEGGYHVFGPWTPIPDNN